jgi:hypothetical protein
VALPVLNSIEEVKRQIARGPYISSGRPSFEQSDSPRPVPLRHRIGFAVYPLYV